jgi:Protein kinase domain
MSLAVRHKVTLTDFEMTTTLGTGKKHLSAAIVVHQVSNCRSGSFGRVMLAKNKKTGEFSAMKRLKKADIIKLRQVDHVISENTILSNIDHPFLVRNF